MHSELPTSPLLGLLVKVARGADLVNASLRARFLVGTTAALVELAELAFESAWRRLPRVFFGTLALARGTALELVKSTGAEVESELLLPSTKGCVTEKLEAEFGSSWMLSSELRLCSGNRCAKDVDGPGSFPNAPTVAVVLGAIIAAVPTR